MDGFYAAYLTGRGGNTVVLLAIKSNSIVGVDAGGMKYDLRSQWKGPPKTGRASRMIVATLQLCVFLHIRRGTKSDFTPFRGAGP